MTSLTDVYDGGVGTAIDVRRRILGAGLFALGAGMVVTAIPVATTELGAELGLGVYEARELAGILAGLGLPAVLVGIFAVLPAGPATRAAAAIGASVAVLGVALFAAAYPYSWISNHPTLAVATAAIYSVGTLVTFWCLFVGLAMFTRRNDPGGSARIVLTDEGKIRVVNKDSRGVPGFGSVGTFGSKPDTDVETQTNRSDRDGGQAAEIPSGGNGDDATIIGEETSKSPTTAGTEPAPASDGAGSLQSVQQTDSATPTDPAAANADIRAAVDRRGQPDQYCGNCKHFEYVRANGDMAPYCGFHDDLLEDMDACEQWETNS